MNAEQLLTHFDRIANAPAAIPRLRRFILDLAVRGKLVEQDPNDESASELLKRIVAEKAWLVKNKRIKKSEVPPIGEEDAPFSTPSLWRWTRLGMIGDWGAGSTPSRGNPDLYGGGLTWLKSGELDDNTQLQGSEETVTDLSIRKGSFRFNRPGDVLIAMYGATIGKLAILAEDAVTNQAVCGCTPFEGVLNKYLFLFLFSQRESFRATSEGGAQPNISKVKIVRRPFPLPPLAEQHRIVAKVDELMALCDRLEEARTERKTTRDRLTAASLACLDAPDPDPEIFQRHVSFALDNLIPLTTRPDQIQALRQTILNLTVRGKLVEQDPNDEPASELLKQITAEKARLVKEKRIRARRPSTPAICSDVPFDLPTGWSPVKIEQILIEIQTGPFGSSLHQSDYQLGGTPVINPASIQNERIVPVDKMAVGPVTLERLASFKLRTGDVIMGRRGEMGRCAVVSERERGWLCGTGSLILRAFKNIYPRFLSMLIGSPFSRQYLGGTAVGTTMQNLNQTILLNLSFGIPPLAEQHRIVAKVDELLELCDQLEASLNMGNDTRRRLLETLLDQTLKEHKEPFSLVIESRSNIV